MTDEPQLPEAELAALADGSLPAAQREQLRARIEASPELAAALAEQERAVTMLRALDEPAPSALHARVREMADAASPGSARATRRRVPRSLFIPAATVLAVVVAALVVLLGGGGSGSPSVPQTARLALAAATLPAPVEDEANRDRLRLSVGGIAFPYYGRTAGWETTGARTDTLHGRRVTTVFYEARGRRVGYAIVSGPPLPVRSGRGVTIGGVRYTFQRVGAAQLITWVQDSHTCVIAGRGVNRATLLGLAAAEERDAV